MSIFLKDDRVILKKLSAQESLEKYLQFINDVEHLKWMDGVGNFPQNEQDLRQYIASNVNLLLGIFDHAGNHAGNHVGNIQLSAINFQHRNALFGIILDRHQQGKGLASSAALLVLKHAFEVLNLHRICLTVVEGNQQAIQFYEGLGFVREGVEKDLHYYKFKFYDGVRYHMLEDQYRSLHGQA